jgi:hypothetical protein
VHVTAVPPHAPFVQWSLVVHWLPSLQAVPVVALPFGTQTDCPVAHEVEPVWQTLPPGLQKTPEVQDVHCPALQTLFVPHGVPASALFPVSVQTMAPLTQETVPTWQGFVEGTHAAPFVHAWHAPRLQ